MTRSTRPAGPGTGVPGIAPACGKDSTVIGASPPRRSYEATWPSSSPGAVHDRMTESMPATVAVRSVTTLGTVGTVTPTLSEKALTRPRDSSAATR